MFTKVFESRTSAVESLVAPKRFAFEFTPKDVAVAVLTVGHRITGGDTDLDALVDGKYDEDGEWVVPASPEEVREFVAKHVTQAAADEALRDVLFGFGMGEHTYLALTEGRQISDEVIEAVAAGLVDRMVKPSIVERLFEGRVA